MRDRKRKIEKGEAKKAKEKQRETLKNKQKCPFLGGKQGFSIRNKKRKGKKNKTTNKSGGFSAK